MVLGKTSKIIVCTIVTIMSHVFKSKTTSNWTDSETKALLLIHVDDRCFGADVRRVSYW